MLLGSILFAVLLPGVVAAQSPQPSPEEGLEQSPAAAAEAPRFGRIVVDETQLYCWPSAVVMPPKYEDTLTKDQVVKLGRTEDTFIRIEMPLGPMGYVSKRYSTTDEAGNVRSKGTKVAFRYRTRTTEAPVLQLADGTELFVIGEAGDWWRVRLPAAEAWLPLIEVQIGDAGDTALAADYATSKAIFENEVQKRLDAIAEIKRLAEQNEADAAAVQLVSAAFQKELQKPGGEQQFAALSQVLDRVEGTLSEKSSARTTIASLRKRIQAQEWIVEATALRDSKPERFDSPVITPQPKDELERFHSIGWLRYERRLGGMGTYYLEKGGLRLHHVTCSTGRYDLALFIDCEVGIQGPRRRPASESFSLLDAECLEVLGHTRN
jgi:hypothetical protein